MPLREYARKRDFTRTPEPRGRTHADPNGGRAFVIQKHAASRLHWDFRLELDGVLKSWAVPKGPSLDPADKRLAMHVEDHPVEYGDFEGVIPAGEYGGGTVMLWDRGTWTPAGDAREGYRKGSLKFRLDGERLQGGWALVRMRGRSERDDNRTWLLIKEKDGAARAGWDAAKIEGKAKSVASDRSMEQIAAAKDRVWHAKDAPREGPSTPSPASAGRPTRAKPAPAARAASRGRSGTLPRFVPPELATLVSEAPDGDAWLHEIKFDGYRLLARLEDGRVRLMSRNDKDWTARLPDIAEAVGRLPARRALIDGEAVVLQPDGTSSFQALQNLMQGERRGELAYMVFDLLHLDGRDLTALPLEERKGALRKLVGEKATGIVRYSAHVVGGGAEFLRQACRLHLEGAVAKRRDAPYRSGRGRDWLKIKCGRRQEVVIGGFTRGEGSRVGLGALLVGVREGPRLVFAGKVGTGFDAKSLRALTSRLEKLERRDSPFDPSPRIAGARWVKPELVAEVAFTEWTSDGKMRHPSFQGLREDKLPAEVRREVETAPSAGAGDGRTVGDGATVGGVRLTHPDRVLFPKPRTTKLDLARYYESIAEWMLPHLAGRPTTLVRCPDGIDGKCFYQRHAGPGAAGNALRRVKISGQKGEGLVVDSLAGLITTVQLGILEIHTWNATVDDIERPDRIVLDLDPGPGVTWARVVEAARLVRGMLERAGLESFVKTSGGKGLHVVAPLTPGASWDETGAFTRAIADSLARRQPECFTATMTKTARPGKIYVDYLRNRRAASTVALLSARARAGAPVSMPLAWDELSPRVTPDRFTVATVPAQLAARREDPWVGYRKVRQRLPRGGGGDTGPG